MRLHRFSMLLALAMLGRGATAQELSFEAQVDGYLKPYLETGNFSGSVLVAQEGEILLSKGYGFADQDRSVPNVPETVYYLASVSRIFTSAAIVLLEQQGKLSIEDPLSKYIPDWPRGDEITIHHLLSLSAGFPNINTMPGYFLWSQSPQTPGSLIEKFKNLPLEFDPGTRTEHSNSNYNVLAALIERISGQTYGEFLEDEFLAPLGMVQTAHDVDSSVAVPHRASGLTPVGLAELAASPSLEWSVKTGNGSIYSTTTDLYKLDRMLANTTLLNEASVEKLFTEHFPANGYGWFIGERFGTTEIHINGRSPGFGTYWGRSVGEDVTVILLGNIYNSVTTALGRDLIAMVLGEVVDPSSLRFEAPDPELLAELVGAYQFGPDFYAPNRAVSFRIRDGHLFNGADWAIPAGDMKFVHRVYWSDLEFLRDATGKVTRLQYDDFIGVRRD